MCAQANGRLDGSSRGELMVRKMVDMIREVEFELSTKIAIQVPN